MTPTVWMMNQEWFDVPDSDRAELDDGYEWDYYMSRDDGKSHAVIRPLSEGKVAARKGPEEYRRYRERQRQLEDILNTVRLRDMGDEEADRRRKAGHHIWCNFSYKDPAICTMCWGEKAGHGDGLQSLFHKGDLSPDELMAKHFPDNVRI